MCLHMLTETAVEEKAPDSLTVSFGEGIRLRNGVRVSFLTLYTLYCLNILQDCVHSLLV